MDIKQIPNQANKRRGFTIVELLIVIVVIGILAAISSFAYNGIQGRARDAKRQTDLASVLQGLELYYIDTGGYPNCSGGTYQPGLASGYGTLVSCLASLAPKYIPSTINDPLNIGSYQYQYAFGYRKLTSTGFTGDLSDNYILGAKLETSSAPQYEGWLMPDLNYLGGSNH